jgi:hypothetical protein
VTAVAEAAPAQEPEPEQEPAPEPEPTQEAKLPLYWRALRLRHLHPNGWQRALLVEGVIGVAALLVLADLASAWALLVLPAAVALVVKANDLLAGWLGPARATRPEEPRRRRPSGPAPSKIDQL